MNQRMSAIAATSDFAAGPVTVRVDDRPLQPEPEHSPHGGAHGRSRLSAMECAFLPTGGIVSGERLSQLLRHGLDQPISVLARWIVDRLVVSFEVHGQIWLPMFQFEPSTLRLRPGVLRVIEELRGVFGDSELAEWFAHPNSWLEGQSPASAIARDEQAVLDAARADRFVAAG
jgi:hypothetical protein